MLALILTKSTPLIEYKRNHEKPDENAYRAAIALIELLNKRGWEHKVVVQSFDIIFLAHCRELAPDVILGWLIMDELVVHLETVERELNPEIIGWKREQLTKTNLIWIQERSDARIWSWYGGDDNINDPALTLNMLDMGIHGVITDYPAQAKVVVHWREEQQ
jgi:glycerophosphoryl diester phosphodiesterase